ncbi:MAG: pantoate--beta-alanine ligase [Bacteroidia bacterium]|nr:pantoate--beta-alanine ligase [Bacteroidia bacterium]
MLIFSKIADLQGYLSPLKSNNQTIGFVPTMGALHKGHLSLINASKEVCSLTVCSIFVNPTQFNDPKDLERYPRTPEKDINMLESVGCDVLFMPGVEEMYPGGSKKELFDFGYLDKILEGAFRPGHFSGVAQVVKRLFEIVKPDKAFFGSKDYQQVMIVKALVKQMNAPIEIVPCPILREPDGLAMSSRNILLSPSERAIASNVPKIMESAVKLITNTGIDAAKFFVQNEVANIPDCRYDYFEVCDADTLEPCKNLEGRKTYVALIALFVGRIRLIDNLVFSL